MGQVGGRQATQRCRRLGRLGDGGLRAPLERRWAQLHYERGEQGVRPSGARCWPTRARGLLACSTAALAATKSSDNRYIMFQDPSKTPEGLRQRPGKRACQLGQGMPGRRESRFAPHHFEFQLQAL